MLNGRPESREEAAGFHTQELRPRVSVTISVTIVMDEANEKDAESNFSRNVAYDMCKTYGERNVSWDVTECEECSELVIAEKPDAEDED